MQRSTLIGAPATCAALIVLLQHTAQAARTGCKLLPCTRPQTTRLCTKPNTSRCTTWVLIEGADPNQCTSWQRRTLLTVGFSVKVMPATAGGVPDSRATVANAAPPAAQLRSPARKAGNGAFMMSVAVRARVTRALVHGRRRCHMTVPAREGRHVHPPRMPCVALTVRAARLSAHLVCYVADLPQRAGIVCPCRAARQSP
jgi:hypothetical protein